MASAQDHPFDPDTDQTLPCGADVDELLEALGNQFTCALLQTGDVKCFGRNAEGELGQGDTTNRGDMAGQMGDALPRVPLVEQATAIAAGQHSACALLASGSLQCWGDNSYGQLGLGDTQNRGDDPGEMTTNVIAASTLFP